MGTYGAPGGTCYTARSCVNMTSTSSCAGAWRESTGINNCQGAGSTGRRLAALEPVAPLQIAALYALRPTAGVATTLAMPLIGSAVNSYNSFTPGRQLQSVQENARNRFNNARDQWADTSFSVGNMCCSYLAPVGS